MARSAVSKNSLLKIDGMDAVIKKVEAIIEKTSGGTAGAKLKKQVYIPAATVISNQVRLQISNLDASKEVKEALAASVGTNEGKESQPNAIVIVSQPIGVRRLGEGVFVPNPYWYEYGTRSRFTKKGARRGQINPQPFFRPAVETARSKATNVLVDGLKKLIDL